MRKATLSAALLALVIGLNWIVGKITTRPFPEGTTPEGAYLRIVLAISEERPQDTFAYLETEAQWACFTVYESRKSACELIRAHFPAGVENDAYGRIREDCDAKDGPGEFALLAKRHGWTVKLRKDLSGVVQTEIDGPRATVLTARGTRYAFRKRDNGLWGLTMFTSDLLAESERATRDLAVVRSSAEDYARAKGP